MQFLKIAIASLLVALFCQPLADAKVVYVNAAAAPAGDGTSWPTACRFLQDALALTVTGDEVWIAAGTYYPDDGASVTTGDRTASFTLKQDVKLYGGFAGGESDMAQRNAVANVTILSGEIWTEKLYWSLHVVTLAGDASLDGFTVTKGNANGDSAPHNQGAGITSLATGSLVLANCRLATNTAISGGAIYSSAPIRATDCVFTGNTSTSGGAIYTYYSSVDATNCNFSGNTASSPTGGGGAIYTYYSSITVKRCDFSGNSSSSSGGAVYFGVGSSYSITATDCTFSNNTASSSGGAICLLSSSSSVTAINCNFSDNAASSGGAVYSSTSSSSVIATNCSFSDNSASSSGGAIYSRSVRAANCSFAGNAASSGGAIYSYSSSSNSSVTATTSTFLGNMASLGGAIYSSSGYPPSSVTAINCALSNNTAATGGAIYCSSLSSINATNSTFSGNAASSTGGAIFLGSNSFGAPLTLTNCTMVNNLAKGVGKKGGSIYSNGLVKIFNNIIWHVSPESQDNQIYISSTGSIRNSDGEFPSPMNQAKNFIKGSTAAITAEAGAVESLGDTATTVLSNDPLFSDVANPVGLDGIWRTADDGLRLQAGSPALDLGLSIFLPVDTYDLDDDGAISELIPVDLADYDRIQNLVLDLGAYEEGDSFQPINITNQPANTVVAIGATSTLSVTTSGKGLTYQWYQGARGDMSHPMDGGNQPVFTTPALSETSSFWVRITSVHGTLDSDTATVTVIADPVAAALNKESSLSFTADGNAAWFAQSITTHDGFAAVQSGVITHSQTSSVQTSVTGAGTLSFWWNVSSQSGGDYLRFYIDGVEQTGSISGTTGSWAKKTFTVAVAGAHTFKWSYTKNSSTSSGSDCGWVDEVVWSPKLITNQPPNQNILSGMNAGLNVSASGTNLTYQWFAGESGITTNPVTGATGPTLTTPTLDRTIQYWVKVGNGVGFESSSTATVTVSPPDPAIANALNSGAAVSYFTWGGMPWMVQSSTTHDGVSAMLSGAISHSQTSVVEAAVDGSGTLSFWWKVSSELGFDFLRFSIDEVEQGSLSGEVGWQQMSFNLAGPGVHKLKWIYSKDDSKASGSDQAWLDQVSWQAAAAATTYQTWVTGYNLTGENALETANPAGDGVSNLVKYALGLNPHQAALTPTDGTHAGLPLLERTGNSVKFTFIKDPAKTDVSYGVEASGDLATWQPVTTGVVETPLTGTLVRVEVTLPVAGRRFCRLRVEK